jgi:hypothetical protein
MSFVVDPTSISESQIFADLQDFVNSRPDADAWQNFFDSGVGVTVLKLMSGLSAYYTYNNIVGRREAYIQYALNRSSIIGGGQQLGYSAFRGKNPVVTLTITPNFTGTINRFSVVGAVKSQELVALETKVVNLGESTTIQCVVGDLKSAIVSATSALPSLFRFTGNGTISDDLRVLVGGTEVEISESVIDIQNFKYIVQTNAVGSVDVFSDNSLNLSTRYDTNTEITLEWVELKQADFVDADFTFDFGDITSINTESVFQTREDKEQIRINARLQNEVQKVIRAREDQPKQFQQLDTRIIGATAEDVSAAVMRIYYILENNFLLSDQEKEDLVEEYNQFRPHGLQPPLIGDPVRRKLIIKVDATLENTSGDPENDIKTITQALAQGLNTTINLANLERDIEALANIKVARPSISGETWVNDKQYEIGEFVKDFPDNGRIYSVFEILYFSAGTEPTWPNTQPNETIIDGDIVWKSIAKDDTAGIADWSATTSYKVGDQVKPTVANGYIFEASEVINESGATEPTWPVLGGLNPTQLQGQFIYDGDILWISRPQEGSPSVWSANQKYTKGQTVIATDQVASDTVGLMFQAFAFVGTSGGSSPTFPTALNQTVVDNNILWISQDPLQSEFSSGIDGYFDITEDITLA